MANDLLRSSICAACNGQFSDEPCEPSECGILRVCDAIAPNCLRPKGRWVEIRGMAPPEYHGKHMCSLCYARALERKYHEELSDHCPSCGAKMEG